MSGADVGSRGDAEKGRRSSASVARVDLVCYASAMAAPGTLIAHDLATARPLPARSMRMAIWHWCGRGFLALGGWQVRGDWPADRKCVIIAAPHTSNWDGIWMIAAAAAWRIRLCYMGKKSLTDGPFGFVVKWTGCIPIDRSQSNDLVRVMAAQFEAADEMFLAVPPEGTRDAVGRWKSGFYHIAVGAGVPITFAVMDYATKTVSLPATYWPTGDYAADLPLIQGFYAQAKGKFADRFVMTGR